MDTQEEIERKDFIQYFTRGTRTDGKSFYKCVDACPEELRDLIRHIHTEYFGCLPNDWIYGVIHEAFLDLKDMDVDDVTIDSDPYNSELYNWMGESFADKYCAKAMQEGLYCPDSDGFSIYGLIGWAQWYAKTEIYHAVNEFINE